MILFPDNMDDSCVHAPAAAVGARGQVDENTAVQEQQPVSGTSFLFCLFTVPYFSKST